MPTLSGKQTGRLSEALREAFVSVDALEEFLDVMLEKRLENIVSLKLNYQTVAFKLIKTADAEGWVPRLIAAACDARPATPCCGNSRRRPALAEYRAALTRLSWELAWNGPSWRPSRSWTPARGTRGSASCSRRCAGSRCPLACARSRAPGSLSA